MRRRSAIRAYYPVFADLKGRRCVVIGGGPVAQRKALTLLRYGARVTVVSPTATRRLVSAGQEGTLRYVPRRFRTSDVRGAWLVYAATDEPAINARVSRAAHRLKIFANVVDRTPLCSFIAPAIVQRGQLTVAISTGGRSPSLAKQLRRELEGTLGRHYAPMLRLLTGLRRAAHRRLKTFSDRRRYFDRVLRGRAFTLVRAGKDREARREALALLDRFAMRNGT